MKLLKNFTQIPDEWWQLCGKYPVVDKETGEILRDKKGKEKYITISHTYIVLLAKIDSFNFVKDSESTPDYRFGKCTASNGYLATFLNVSVGTIKNMMSDLYTLGWLKSYEQREGKMTVKRFLYVNHDVLDQVTKSLPSHQMVTESLNGDHFNPQNDPLDDDQW